ncbi:MAG: MMPL family transporter [bacterium]|nr:MMPL family transporter [bacterium]
MGKFFSAYGRWVGFHPWSALGVVAVITALAVFGFTRTAELADDQEAFLPDGSELVAAMDKLGESFPESAALEAVQVVLRGDVLSPQGAADARKATRAASEHPDLAEYLFVARPAISPGHLLADILAGPNDDPEQLDLASVSPQAAEAALSDPANEGVVAALEELVARNESGAVVGGIGIVTVNAHGDADGLADAQIAVDEAVADVELAGLESARTLSAGKIEKEANDSASTSLALLMLLAFGVIAVLLALFFRQVSDVVLSLAGLILTIVWALGFQGLLGPDGLSLIGAPSVLGQMVPVMLIGLCVDYGIQGTSRYREIRAQGTAGPDDSIANSVSLLMLPLGLAGVTTIVSFLTNLTGDISGLADFGVVAGVGVACGLVVFLTGVPAVRVLLDRRNDAKGRLPVLRPIAQAIPGAGNLVGRIGSVTVRKPAAILVLAGLVTVFFGVLTTRLGTSFNSQDFLPNGTETKEDVVFLSDYLGGNTEPVTVLVESDLSNDRTLRNLLDFSSAIEDPLQRPEAVSTGVTFSLGTYYETLPADLVVDIERDVRLNRTDPLVVDSAAIDSALEKIRAHNPQDFDSVVSLGSGNTTDRTILQFSALTGDSDRTRDLFEEVDGLWFGNDQDITPVANEIVSLEVSDSLTDSQATSIGLTILAALVVLVLFFWVTEFRPMLAVLSVLPILLVLVCVLGTMVLLGFSYNVVTALITALSIGIGVDYTIHITHRFVEEHEHNGKSIADAINHTMRTTGGALIGSALTTALGFAVLIFSPIPPMGQFGLLTAITVTYSLIAAVVVLPPMLVTWAAYHAWRQANQP